MIHSEGSTSSSKTNQSVKNTSRRCNRSAVFVIKSSRAAITHSMGKQCVSPVNRATRATTTSVENVRKMLKGTASVLLEQFSARVVSSVRFVELILRIRHSQWMGRMAFTVWKTIQRSLRPSVPPAVSPLYQRRDRPKHQESGQ